MGAIKNVRQFPRAAIKTSTFLLGAHGAVKVKAMNITTGESTGPGGPRG